MNGVNVATVIIAQTLLTRGFLTMNVMTGSGAHNINIIKKNCMT